LASGSFQILPDGSVVGTLPPGYSKANPPSDAADPSMARRIQASPDTTQLKTLPSVATLLAQRATTLSSPVAVTATKHRPVAKAAATEDTNGCVTAYSYVNTTGVHGLYYKGEMHNCAYGHLWMHTYLNANGSLVQDGDTHDCYNTTGCGVGYVGYTADPARRTFTNYAHGHNYSTGGDSIAYTVWAPF
jgi:hypothetical protein